MEVAPPTTLADLRRSLGPPQGIADRARWLFAGFTLLALAIGIPDPLAAADGWFLLAAAVAVGILAATAVFTYRTERMPLALTVVDAIALAAWALACSDPTTVFGYIFAATWFFALYGSTLRAVLHAGLVVTSMSATLAFWQAVPGHTSQPDGGVWLRTLPLLLICVAVARQLGTGLLVREQSLSRDAALARAGAKLLGVTDAVAIRDIAWAACADLCAATPGLRLMKLVRSGACLRVEQSSGSFAALPATFPGSVIEATDGEAEGRIADTGPLDAGLGSVAAWNCIRITEPVQEVWMVVGAPGGIPAEALLAVRSLVNHVSLALDNSDSHHELTEQARIDSLTGLANRTSFTAELSAHLAEHAGALGLHVLFIDLDDFKNVNDVLGHRAGDELLIEVAGRLLACVGPDDTCARLGGDEFAVMLRNTADAVSLAQSMVNSIAQPIKLSGRTRRVGASIGIAAPTADVDIDQLVHQADVAMYAAKAHGKGRVQVFDSGLLQADTSRLTFERELAAATEAGEIVVHYQPVLSLPDCRCIAVEALVRWEHPTRGLLQPSDFIDTAERTGAIIDIGAFALRLACADIAEWRESYPEQALSVHVNVSAGQLDHDQFIHTVLECLELSGLPPDRLVLELTETVLLSSPAAIDRLKAIAAQGVQIAIDDFGTGYSSLTTLRSLPVNVVKLDTSFIAGALSNAVDRTVIKAIVQMSSQLGLCTIAEGVERPEQQHFLHEVGTDAVQGYLYQRAVPPPELDLWLEGNLGAVKTPHAVVAQLRPRPKVVA